MFAKNKKTKKNKTKQKKTPNAQSDNKVRKRRGDFNIKVKSIFT